MKYRKEDNDWLYLCRTTLNAFYLTMIHYFNPGHETAVSNLSPYYKPPESVLRLQHDLAFLPAWYGKEGDFVLMDHKEEGYLEWLRLHFPGLSLPVTENELPDIPLTEVCFWGISPQAVHSISEINTKRETKLQIPEWREEYAYLTGRKASRDCLIELQRAVPEISDSVIPVFYDRIDDIEDKVKTGPYLWLAKSPYSSSGRGLLWLSEYISNKEREILKGVLKKQNFVSLEPVLPKITDFSMQFLSDGRGNIHLEGYSLFETNPKGVYTGSYLYSQKSISDILSQKISPELMERITDHLIRILRTKYARLYKGCIGVDMMLYNENGICRIQPCVEINMRYNMGYLAVKLSGNFLGETSKGLFSVIYNPDPSVISSRHREMVKKHPPVIRDGKIEKGYIALCPLTENSRYCASAIVENGR